MRMMSSFFSICLVLLLQTLLCDAWVPSSCTTHTRSSASSGRADVFISRSSTTADESGALSTAEQDDDDEDEYEYVELEMLTETDFLGSEWLVGTVFDSSKNSIKETWCRLVVDEKGKNIAVWGDDSTGTWNFDVASQFLSFSKDNLWGKNIWAGVVDDYYFLQGTVRGWSFLLPASVVGQWQARRLGVDADEAGVAPWFQLESSEEEAKERLSQAKPDPDDVKANKTESASEEGV